MINKATLVGRLGADPTIRFMQDGSPVANINLATDESYKKDGEKITKTEWHKVVFFGALATAASDYLAKGRLIYVSGRLQTRPWEDKDGIKRYTTEIVANELKFIDSTKTPDAPPPMSTPSQFPNDLPDEEVPF
ncbi:MAG: Single-stranded DNA-binding protein [Syntrophus sp. SKADARSKE-3]|nr:Single-stranded DNA-binding protein [Syntrophus sp. SKADARSKE-3]